MIPAVSAVRRLSGARRQSRPAADRRHDAFRRIGEAVDSARHSVWLTVAFYDDDLQFPDGRGALFDLLDRAAARGVDVRALFWRHNPESSRSGRTFWGTEAERELLRARSSRLRIRWDRAAGGFCQHQKSWMIDAGTPSETAFVGGINLTAKALERHDAYVEVTGPSATDVHAQLCRSAGTTPPSVMCATGTGLRRHGRAAAADDGFRPAWHQHRADPAHVAAG